MKNFILTLLFTLIAFAPAMVQSSEENPELKSAIDMYPEVNAAVNSAAQVATPCTTLDENKFLVSDSLVKNLDCKTLTKDNVFMSLQDDAFSSEKHMPIQNWSSGALGQCWALSLTQRRLFYLARFGKDVPESIAPTEAKENFLDMIKKKDPGSVFKIGLAKMNSYNSTIKTLFKDSEGSTFMTEIEARQKARFFSPGNLGLIFGDRARSESDNKKTIEDLKKNVKQGRLPIIVLRAAKTNQHVVLVKKIETISDTEYKLTVYDSNQPNLDITMTYKNGQFIAPKIFFFDNDPTSPVGVFMKDDDEIVQSHII